MSRYSKIMMLKVIYDELLYCARSLFIDKNMNNKENNNYIYIMCNFYASNTELLTMPNKLLEEDVINYINIHKEIDPYSNDIDYTSFLSDFMKQ